jgi:hypothetical protein
MCFDDTALSTGTAFVAYAKKGQPVLITNRHNLTGRHQETNIPLSKTGGVPNKVGIFHHTAGQLGRWEKYVEPLYNAKGKALWHEHPTLGNRADFVALPLTNFSGSEFYPYDLSTEGQILISPAETVSVVGFPFGLMSNGVFGIWATGFVATEAELDHAGLPVFLIDCRSRPGQSGSPVIAHRNGGAISMKSGGTAMFGSPVTDFLGIYSGRINPESDLGMVWKREAVKRLIDSL